MRFKIDHDLHIHSQLSTCSGNPEQTAERILAYAKEYGLSEICVTDHYWDSAVPGASKWYIPQNFDNISKILPLPQADGIKFMFGCETDMDKDFTIGVPKERYYDFDFIIVPTTHLHMKRFTIAEEDFESVERKVQLWIDRFDAILNSDLPLHKVGIAHLSCELIDAWSEERYLKVLDTIPESEMVRLFTRAAALGCGIEIIIRFNDSNIDSVLRMFHIAKACGCKFYLGTDAHSPEGFAEAMPYFERTIDILGLTEEDKFHIGK